MSWISVCSHYLILSLCSKNNLPAFFSLPCQVSVELDKVPPSLLFSILTSPNSISLSLCYRYFVTLILLVAKHCKCIFCTQESRTGHSSPGVFHQHWVHEDHLPHPSDNSGPNSAYGAVGLLCHKDTLLAHVQYLVLQDAQIPLHRAAFQAIPQPILHGITQEPDFVRLLAELQEIPVSPLSVKVPLNGTTWTSARPVCLDVP